MTGDATGLNIRWSQEEQMRAAILEVARTANVVVFDPQSDEVFIPSKPRTLRGLLRRQP